MNFSPNILDRKECFLDHKSWNCKKHQKVKIFQIFVLCVIFGKSSQKIAWISSDYCELLLLPQ